MLERFREIVKYGIMYGCITHCTFEYLGDFVVCNGPSMEPTLHSKNILLTERISTRLLKPRPHRGDIIIAKSPTNPNQHICKRIIGLPGDKIITKCIPNDVGNSNYDDDDDEEKEAVTEEYVPRGYVWIEGDNSKNSSDSRYYGPIPQGLIKSRVVCRIWPFTEIKLL